MPSIRNLAPYALAFVPLVLQPVAAFAVAAGVAAWMAAAFPLLFLFVIVPLADGLLGRDRHNPTPDEAMTLEGSYAFRLLTWLMVPAWLLHLVWSLGYAATQDLPIPAGVLWVVSLGVIGGVTAITTAHELIHKAGRFEPLLGGLLLSSVNYAGFKIEHIRGHHVHVSTPLDTSSARLGQSVYDFLPRALIGNPARAWQLEVHRLRERGHSAWHWRNELLRWYGLSLLAALLLGMAWGTAAVLMFVLQGLVAATTLEIINYVEHYGLERRLLPDGRYERVTHLHSWNAAQWLTNSMLFQLQRHADHHARPRRRYQTLEHHEDSPQLPAGYAGMFLLALVPPLWRRTVDPLVHAWRRNVVS